MPGLKKSRHTDTSLIPEILNSIDASLAKMEHVFTGVGVSAHLAGLSLYHYAAAQFNGSAAHRQQGGRCFEQAVELLNNDYISRYLYVEISELGTALEICKQSGQYDSDTNELLNDVDEMVLTQMRADLAEKNFDPAIGALAYGFYYLTRLSSQPAVAAILEELCRELISLAFTDGRGMYWKSKLKNDDAIYLGMSHGSAAIICFLIKATEAGIPVDSKEVIRSAASFIIKSEYCNWAVLFPVAIGQDKPGHYWANNWCYGDPGTLYGLLQAGLFLQDEAITNYAIEKFRSVVDRQNGPNYLIAGYGLLYGHAGLAMIFGKCYRQMDLPFFKTAYEAQLKIVLDAFDPDHEMLGYTPYWNTEIPATAYSFSEGLIGIAMLLMTNSNPSITAYYEPFFYMQ